MTQDLDFTGRVAIVSGASRGIGSVIAAQLAMRGASVVISSRKMEHLAPTAKAIDAESPGRVHAIEGDAGKPEDLKRLVDGTLQRFGRIDHVVYNAGASPHYGPLMNATEDAWLKGFNVNVLGAFTLIKHAFESLTERGGSVVTVASLGGLQPRPNLGVYNTTKAALIMLTRQLAAELGPKQIRVNAVAPGLVKTDFSEALWSDPERLAMVLKENPLGRLGLPEEVAATVVFLLSEGAGFINGHTVVIDGGAGKGR